MHDCVNSVCLSRLPVSTCQTVDDLSFEDQRHWNLSIAAANA